jgi:DnaK suppressor protein
MTTYRNEIETLLLKKLDKLKQQIAELKELTVPEAPDTAIGRESRMDAINNRSINEAALRKKQMQLNKIEGALADINDPDFGKCIKCGTYIPKERIMLMPESKVCINCAN